jgi:hypothetical protein
MDTLLVRGPGLSIQEELVGNLARCVIKSQNVAYTTCILPHTLLQFLHRPNLQDGNKIVHFDPIQHTFILAWYYTAPALLRPELGVET